MVPAGRHSTRAREKSIESNLLLAAGRAGGGLTAIMMMRR
jgi:hypothetical protein